MLNIPFYSRNKREIGILSRENCAPPEHPAAPERIFVTADQNFSRDEMAISRLSLLQNGILDMHPMQNFTENTKMQSDSRRIAQEKCREDGDAKGL